MTGRSHGVIGFDRKTRLDWLDATAGLVAEGVGLPEIRRRLDLILANELPGDTERGARAKTLTVLLHIWVAIPEPLRSFRDYGISLMQRTSSRDRLCFHWGMALSTYPFFRDLAATAGRLLGLQGNATLGQLTRRMAETWGERSTLVRAVRRLTRSMVEWHVLGESKVPGIYEKVSPRAISSEIATWVLESLLHANRLGTASLTQLVQSPALFPFSFVITAAEVRDHPRLELHKRDLDEDVVLLRDEGSKRRVAPG